MTLRVYAQQNGAHWDWIYFFEDAIRHIVGLSSREARLAAHNDYTHAHRLPNTEAEIVKVRAICALVNVEPVIETMLGDRDPAIRHVWLGHVDGDELVVHPGWLRYCLEIGGQNASVAHAVSGAMDDEAGNDE